MNPPGRYTRVSQAYARVSVSSNLRAPASSRAAALSRAMCNQERNEMCVCVCALPVADAPRNPPCVRNASQYRVTITATNTSNTFSRTRKIPRGRYRCEEYFTFIANPPEFHLFYIQTPRIDIYYHTFYNYSKTLTIEILED